RQSTGADGLRGLGQEALHVALDVVGDIHRPASAGRRADLHLEQLLPQVARSVGVAVEVTQRTIAQVKVGVVVVIGVSPDYSPAQLVEERHHLVEVAISFADWPGAVLRSIAPSRLCQEFGAWPPELPPNAECSETRTPRLWRSRPSWIRPAWSFLIVPPLAND